MGRDDDRSARAQSARSVELPEDEPAMAGVYASDVSAGGATIRVRVC